ncbi:DUF3558 domain-containing protein [Prauserella flavalba]|uniref:DUF3558 domain-containing protein n=1 Tax=Prauserella flavalba TaxID=1477506 RepID=UPI0036EABB2D
MRPRPHLIVALSAAALLTACSGEEPGTASPAPTEQTRAPTSTSPTSQAAALPANGAPGVENPLDIDHFLNAPCDTITSAQMEEYFGSGVERKQRTNASTGPECTWFRDDGNARAGVAVAFPQVTDQGLSALYGHRDDYAYFNELDPVAGYPAVAYDGVDGRGEGQCAVRVGTSDEATVDITIYLSRQALGSVDPCDAAHEVATAVVGNIKARN